MRKCCVGVARAMTCFACVGVRARDACGSCVACATVSGRTAVRSDGVMCVLDVVCADMDDCVGC